MGLIPDDLGSFDVGRLTLAGWGVLLLSGVAGFAPIIAIQQATKAKGPPDNLLTEFIALPICLAAFFSIKAAARLAGVRLVRPPKTQRDP